MPEQTKEKSLHRIWERWDVLAASLGINLLGLALPIAILQTYDRVIKHHSYDTLSILVLFTVIAFGGEFALRVLRANLMGEEGARFDHQENCRTLARLLAIDVDTFKRSTPGQHADRFHAIQAVRSFYGQASALIADLPFIFIFIALIALIAGWMAILPLSLCMAFGALGLVVARRLTAETDRREKSDVKRHNFLVECLSGIATIKMLSAESLMLRRHERLQEEAAETFASIARVNALTQATAAELAQAASILTVAVGAIAVTSGALTVGGLAATTILTGRLLQPLVKGLGLLSRYPFVRLAEQKLRAIEDVTPQISGDRIVPRRLGPSLKLENVTFRYAGSARDVIEGLNLEVAARTYVGITGPMSSGRSTLLRLMNGLLTPTGGSVRYDNVPTMLYDAQDLRRQIALMPTEPTIYAGTLLENLTSFQNSQVKRRALALCRVLGLEDHVATLSRGLETLLSGTGDVPVGVAQRISIVRALAQNPRVVLFDSANAALDHDSDRRLLAFFARQRGKRTAVFVTDRPSYLNLCHVVYEFDEGKLRLRKGPVAAQSQIIKAAG